MSIRLVIADDHPMVVKGLMDIIRPYAHMEVLATYGTGRELLLGLPEHTPDILLLDLQLPDITGYEVARSVMAQHPEVRILIVSSIDTLFQVKEMMQIGCRGYLLKSTTPETLIKAIETVYGGEEFIEAGMKEQLLASVLHTKKKSSNAIRLTKREQEILNLVCEGLNNYDIGDKLFLSHRTVENHRMSLLQKFDVKNSTALVRAALRQGYIQ